MLDHFLEQNRHWLEFLANKNGYDSMEQMFVETMDDSEIPGICMVGDCEYTTLVEPDVRSGWCELCELSTVSSWMILVGAPLL